MIQSILITFHYDNPESYRPYHVLFVSIFIVFPICLVKTAKSFKFAPMIPFISISYCCLVLFIESFFYWVYDKKSHKILYFRLDMNFFSAFGMTFLAYMCQGNYFESMRGIEKRDAFHQKRVFIHFKLIGYCKIF